MKFVVVGPILNKQLNLKNTIFSGVENIEKIVIVGLKENIPMPILFSQLEIETDANFSKADPSS